MLTGDIFEPLVNDGAPYNCGYRDCKNRATYALTKDAWDELKKIDKRFQYRALCTVHQNEALDWFE